MESPFSLFKQPWQTLILAEKKNAVGCPRVYNLRCVIWWRSRHFSLENFGSWDKFAWKKNEQEPYWPNNLMSVSVYSFICHDVSIILTSVDVCHLFILHSNYKYIQKLYFAPSCILCLVGFHLALNLKVKWSHLLELYILYVFCGQKNETHMLMCFQCWLVCCVVPALVDNVNKGHLKHSQYLQYCAWESAAITDITLVFSFFFCFAMADSNKQQVAQPPTATRLSLP